MRLQALGVPRLLLGRSPSGPLLLFDERCSICRRLVAMVIHADAQGLLRIAPLQGRHGSAVRQRHPELGSVSSAVWVPLFGPAVGQSDAILAALEYLGNKWGMLARIGRLVPRPLRDWLYRRFAGNRRYFSWIGLDELDARTRARLLAEDDSGVEFDDSRAR